jgi:F-type H+-transporting ATPase subunit b
MVILLLLYAAYELLVGRPLRSILAQRRGLTEGAILKARADVAAAEARTEQYEEKLREARAAIFKAAEARRQAAQQARDAVIAQAREIANRQIREAHAAIEQEMNAARAALQADSDRLANQIIQAVLKPAGAIPVAGGQQ